MSYKAYINMSQVRVRDEDEDESGRMEAAAAAAEVQPGAVSPWQPEADWLSHLMVQFGSENGKQIHELI